MDLLRLKWLHFYLLSNALFNVNTIIMFYFLEYTNGELSVQLNIGVAGIFFYLGIEQFI